MKALITGGAGFIGSNIVRQWLQIGHEAVVLDSLKSGYKKNLVSGVRFIEGDIRNAHDVEDAIQGCTVVFNLAASVGNKRSIDNPFDDADINVLGLLHILDAAKRNGIRKIIHSSSAGIFGELKTSPINEDHPQDPDTPYGISKLAGEKLCLAYNRLYQMENVCLRYFNVYGPFQRFDEYGNVIPIFATKTLKGEPITIFGDGKQTRDFAHVRDVANANIQCAITPGVNGVFNIGSGTRISINELAAMLIEVTGINSEVIYGAVRPGDVRDSLADIRKAQSAFGFKPNQDIYDGLVEYVQWLKADQ